MRSTASTNMDQATVLSQAANGADAGSSLKLGECSYSANLFLVSEIVLELPQNALRAQIQHLQIDT